MATTVELMEPHFRRLEEAVLAIAPERVDELVSNIFKGKRWRLEARAGAPVAGVNPFVAHPPDKIIEVTYGGLAMVWCLSVYAALTLDLVVHVDGQQGGQVDVGSLFGRLQPFLDYATQLRTHDEDWPAGLPAPVDGRPDEPYAMVERIFYGALSWILLHEIAHVHLQHRDDLLPREKILQEDDADRFATRWVFDRIRSNEEREFRILSVGVAISWLLLFEPHGGDPNHPPAVTRLMHVASYFDAPRDSLALEVLAHLLKILFFPADPLPEFDTAQELFEWTVGLFR